MPKNSFILNFDGTTQTVQPIWGKSLALSTEQEQEQFFYRKKLTGKLTFVRKDFHTINNADFETEFSLKILEGETEAFEGIITKTDCDFDEDKTKLDATPQAQDRYKKILEGLDREIDFLKLSPTPVTVTYRENDRYTVNVDGNVQIGGDVDINPEDLILIEGEEIEVQGYYLHEVIRVLLQEIDPTINHTGNFEFSQFLYSEINPISGVNEPDLVIVPITNITAGAESEPATRANIRLSEIIQLLKNTYQLGWLIGDSNNLVLEHISYFEKGGSYTTNRIGTDLTQLVEPRHEKRWDYKTRKYKFEKSKMSERIEFKWMGKVSEEFEGHQIVMKSTYVEKGKIDQLNVSKFISDLAYLQDNKGDFPKEGFVLIGVDGINKKVVNSTIPTFEDKGEKQNGRLSFPYLHEKFWKHGLPAKEVIINNTEQEALSVTRRKVQEISFPKGVAIDPMRLIKTALGDGKVQKLTEELNTGFIKATILHDTEG